MGYTYFETQKVTASARLPPPPGGGAWATLWQARLRSCLRKEVACGPRSGERGYQDLR